MQEARANNWKSLPIGERTATVGRAMVGTRYKSYTLEIDDRIEAPSVNFNGMDCWTFFEISLGFARMLDDPATSWTPEQLLHYIELDRYRGGQCTGEYLSRLHYLEDWLADNDRRGLVDDLTQKARWRAGESCRARDDLRLAALSLLESESVAPRAARAHGSESERRDRFIRSRRAAWRGSRRS